MKIFNKSFLLYHIVYDLDRSLPAPLVSARIYKGTKPNTKKGKRKIAYRRHFVANELELKYFNVLNVPEKSNYIENYKNWHQLVSARSKKIFYDLSRVIEILDADGWHLIRYTNTFPFRTNEELLRYLKPIHLVFKKGKSIALIEDNFDWQPGSRTSLEVTQCNFTQDDLAVFNNKPRDKRKYPDQIGIQKKVLTLPHRKDLLKNEKYLQRIKESLVSRGLFL